jgi:hypothetical protein
MFWLFATAVLVLAVYNKGFRTVVFGLLGLGVLVIGVWYIHDRWTAAHWEDAPIVQDSPKPFDPDAFLAQTAPHRIDLPPPPAPAKELTVDDLPPPPPLVDCAPIRATIKKANLAGNTEDANTLRKYLLTVRCR